MVITIIFILYQIPMINPNRFRLLEYTLYLFHHPKFGGLGSEFKPAKARSTLPTLDFKWRSWCEENGT